ncbi:MAG: DJ-1/PfpI family protein [Mariprofundaceae bacterium]
MSNVLIPFTEGVEEIELVCIIDLLRRAKIKVTSASLDGQAALGRSNITILPDVSIADVIDDNWDMIVLPGGLPNAHLLRDNKHVQALVQRLHNERKTIAAICAAPTALAAYGITAGKKVTAYPCFQADMEKLQPSSVYVDQAVVEDDFLITSQGPGTAIAFALRLITRLCDRQTAQDIKTSIIDL